MANKVEILSLDIDTQALISKMTQTRGEIDKLKAAQKELTNSNQANSDAYSKNAVELTRLQSTYNTQKNVVTQLSNANNAFATASAAISSAIEKENTSIAAARENNKQLLTLRNQVNVNTVEGQTALTAINAKLDENNAFIKANVSAYEQQKISIGDYKNQIKEAFNELNIFNGGIGGFIQRSKEAGGVGNLLTNSLKAVSQGIIGMTRASLAFLATPIGAVIGAIGLVLGGLITYLKSTQDGIDKITAVTRPLQAIFQSMIGVLQQVGKFLFEAFSNPKKTLEDLADFVKQNLINRFTAFGEILQGIIELDFKKVTNGVLQAGTGVENLTDKIADGAKATGKFLDEAAAKGKEIDDITKNIEKSEINLNKERAKTEGLIKAQQLISKDTSRNINERVAAQNEIVRLQTEEAEKEANILKLKIQKLKIQQSLNDTSREENKELADLEAQLITTQQKGQDAQLEGIRVTSAARKEAAAQAAQIEKDRQAAEQKALDALIQKNKDEIDLYIQSQGIRKKSMSDEIALEETLLNKRLEVLKKEFEAKKITETKFQVEQLKLKNDYAKKQAELVASNADKELEIFISNNKTKLDNSIYTDDKLFAGEIERLNKVSEAEAEAATKKLVAGIISTEEYNTAIKAIDDKFAADKEAAALAKAEADKVKKAIDLENKLIADQIESDNDFAFRAAELKRNEEQEINAAAKTGANVELINSKYAAKRKALDEEIADFKLNQEIQLLNGIKGLANQNTILFKAAATAEVVLSTIKKFNEARNIGLALAANPLTAALAPNAFFQAGLIAAGGALQVAKITGVKLAKGKVDIDGPGTSTSDSIPAMLSKGESVINAKATAKFKPLLQSINDYGLNPNLTYPLSIPSINSIYTKNTSIDYDLLAYKLAQANSTLPTPVVSVQDINYSQNQLKVIEQMANF